MCIARWRTLHSDAVSMCGGLPQPVWPAVRLAVTAHVYRKQPKKRMVMAWPKSFSTQALHVGTRQSKTRQHAIPSTEIIGVCWFMNESLTWPSGVVTKLALAQTRAVVEEASRIRALRYTAHTHTHTHTHTHPHARTHTLTHATCERLPYHT